MKIRSLLNAAYSALIQHMDEKELAAFDRSLIAQPKKAGEPDRPRSRGVGALMAAVGGLQLPTPPPKRAES